MTDLQLVVPAGAARLKLHVAQYGTYFLGDLCDTETLFAESVPGHALARQQAGRIVEIISRVRGEAFSSTAHAQHVQRRAAYEDMVQYLKGLVCNAHAEDPAYLIKRDTSNLAEIKSAIGLVAPSPALVESLKDADDVTQSKYAETRLVTCLRIAITGQWKFIQDLIPLCLVLLAIKLTPSNEDDKLLHLDILDDYVMKLPDSSFFTMWNCVWLVGYGVVVVSSIIAATSFKTRGSTIVSIPELTVDNMDYQKAILVQPVEPRWDLYWRVYRLKACLGAMAGVSEELVFRCVFVLSGMVSIASYSLAIEFILGQSFAVVAVAEAVFVGGGGIGLFFGRSGSRIAAMCFVVAATIHVGGVVAIGWYARDIADTATFFNFNSLFGRSSEHDECFVLSLIVSSVAFCAGHAYQAKLIQSHGEQEVSGGSVFMVTFTKLFPAIMCAETMLEHGLGAAMFWHSLHDVAVFFVSASSLTAMLLEEDKGEKPKKKKKKKKEKKSD